MATRLAALLAVTALVVGACGSDDDGETSSADPSTTSEAPTPTEGPTGDDADDGTTTTTEPVTGPAPGVTDRVVKIGIAHVDIEAVAAIGLDFDPGDYPAVWNALVAGVNDGGGINGRMLEPVIEAVDPTSDLPAEEVCTRMADDEEVFLITGFWLRDSVLCPVDTFETAVVGGQMTPERLDRARAPWISWDPDHEQPEEIVRTFADRGELDGSVGVFVNFADRPVWENQVEPVLDELGIEPAAVGVVQAPPGDQIAIQGDVELIAERFRSADVDTVLIVGPSGVEWPRYMMANQSYRPKLLFTSLTAANAFIVLPEATDKTVLDGALSGGSFGPAQASYDEPSMTACIAGLEDAGIDVPQPDDFPPDDTSNVPWTAAFDGCRAMALVRAWLEAAGENLDYGTLERALAEGFEVAVPGDPTPRSYGPPPAGDGDPAAYLFGWDEAAQEFLRIDG